MKIWFEHILRELAEAGSEVVRYGKSAEISGQKFTFVNAGESHPPQADDGAWIIHEDLFRLRPVQLISRMRSMVGLNTAKIHGRKSKTAIVSKAEARAFCEANHLLGFNGGAVFLGLHVSEMLVAVAVFSKSRWMKYETPPYYSTELVRYCTVGNVQVVGGLDKLIKHYLKTYETDDIVTYIDKEWSNGVGYRKIGFDVVDETPPLTFIVSRTTFVRKLNVDVGVLAATEYLVSNRGNIKLRLKVG